MMTANPDILGNPACQSVIGNLKKVRVDGNSNNYRVRGGVFEFSANQCSASIDGRDLDVSLSNRNNRIELSTSVLERRDWRQECRFECYPLPTGGSNCQQRCEWVPWDRYIDGRFVKMN